MPIAALWLLLALPPFSRQPFVIITRSSKIIDIPLFLVYNYGMDINNPHDKIFTEITSNRENAIDFIQGTFPAELVSNLDLKKMKLDKNSYINENLKESFADVVYDCVYRGEKRTKIKISLLFEHKSYPDKNIYFQILKYMLSIWEFHLNNKLKLPVIIPVVFYHGKEKWHHRDFSDYFKNVDDDILQFLPEFNYLLTDLARYDEDTIKNQIFQRDSLKISMLIMKNAFQQKYLEKHIVDYVGLGKDFYLTDEGKRFIAAITHYFLSITNMDYKEYVKSLKDISEEGGDIAMTAAVKLRKEGKIEGKIEDAKKLKYLGVDINIIAEATGLSKEQIEKL